MILLNSQLQQHLLLDDGVFNDNNSIHSSDQINRERNVLEERKKNNNNQDRTFLCSNDEIKEEENEIESVDKNGKDYGKGESYKDTQQLKITRPLHDPKVLWFTSLLAEQVLLVIMVNFFTACWESPNNDSQRCNDDSSKIEDGWKDKMIIMLITIFVIGKFITYTPQYYFYKNEYWKNHDVAIDYGKQYQETYQRHRNRIQISLGSIGAPCLMERMRSYDTSTNIVRKLTQHDNDVHFKITTLTEQHSRLLRTIDRSVQLIRVATSVQLGLGPWSFSVDRVDANATYKQNATVNLKVIRGMIVNVLKQQAASILQIRNLLLNISSSLREDEDKDGNKQQCWEEGDDIMQDDLINESIQSSKLFTIALIKSMRAYMGDLLSETLSLCLSLSSSSSALSSSNNEDFVQLLSQSTSLAEELELYITASLPQMNHDSTLGDNPTDSNGTNKNKRSPLSLSIPSVYNEKEQLKWKLISQLQRYVDGVTATTWAYQRSILQKQQIQAEHEKENEHIKNTLGDITKRKALIETTMLWKKLGDEIHNVSDLYQSIHQLYYNTLDDNIRGETEEDSITMNNESSIQNNKLPCETEEYSDKGIMTRPISMNGEDATFDTTTHLKNKTLVFSGKGAKSTQQTVTNKKFSVNSSPSLPKSFFGESSTASQTILLRELQSRLELLEQAEEWDAIENQKLHNDSGKIDVCNTNSETVKKQEKEEVEMRDWRSKCKVKDDTSPSSAFFLGVSGSLLSELKVALSNTDTDIHDGFSKVE